MLVFGQRVVFAFHSCSIFLCIVYQTRVLTLTKEKKKSTKKNLPEPEAEADVWTTEQLEALIDAKLKISTTASNFWAQVRAHHLQMVFGASERYSTYPFCCVRW